MLAPYREIPFAPRDVVADRQPDGAVLIQSPIAFDAKERSVCDYLPYWAGQAPADLFLAERDASGGWRALTYGETWRSVGGIGEGLIAAGIRSGSRIAILSGNSIDHALLMLAGMSIGAIVVPISPNYSLMEGSLQRLTVILQSLRPAAVFTASARAFHRALDLRVVREALLICSEADSAGLTIGELADREPGAAFEASFASIKPEMTAKILFTSGSTGSPKGVINTHGMLANVVAMASLLAPSVARPVQLEWLPWHHTMGGNASFNSVLRNGGVLYVDDGRPTPQLFHKTLENLKDVSPTTMLNVPVGYGMLADALERDDELRDKVFARLQRMTYGGAAIPKGVLDRLQAQSVRATGLRIPITSGYGITETSPTLTVTHWPSEDSGEIGLPLPGLKVKLQPVAHDFELCVKGPSVTPGYWNDPAATSAAFDEAGFYRTGDVVAFIDPEDPSRGLRFVGRLSENFKLGTGTWVSVNEIRIALLNATGGLLQDLVVAGENQDAIGVLAWPNRREVANRLQRDLDAMPNEALCADLDLKVLVANAFATHNERSGASARVKAFRLLAEPPSISAGEITDKGYVNQRAVLQLRARDVAGLFREADPAGVVTVACPGQPPRTVGPGEPQPEVPAERTAVRAERMAELPQGVETR